MTASTGGDVNSISFQCGYKADCSTVANSFNEDCVYWQSLNPPLTKTNQIAFCSSNMTDPCKALTQSAPSQWIQAITNYCKSDKLRTDSAYCAALCNNKDLNGFCDTAITAYCNPATNANALVEASKGGGAEVCGCYMPGSWYTATQDAILVGLPKAASTAIKAAQNVSPSCWLPQCATVAKYRPIVIQNAKCTTTQLCIQNIAFTTKVL
jgi:hypothetical protein